MSVNLDFNLINPQKDNLLKTKWDNFKTKIVNYYYANIWNQQSIDLLNQAKTTKKIDCQDYVFTILLNSVLLPSARFSVDGNTKKKATIKDANESFVLQLTTISDYSIRIKEIIELPATSSGIRLDEHILSDEPIIVTMPDTSSQFHINREKIITDLKNKSLALCLQLYSKSTMPRKDVLNTQSMVSDLLGTVSATIRNIISNSNSNLLPELQNDIDCILNFCDDPVMEIKSEHRIITVLKAMNLYESPKPFVILNEIADTVVQGNPTLDSKKLSIQIMPLKFQFKALFELPNVLQMTLENTEKFLADTNFSNFCNGQIFHSIKLKFDSQLVIPYVLYFDEFQINNDLDLKCCGNRTSFFHLLEELKSLEEGILIQSFDQTFKVHFVLGLIVGDNLGVNSILGFVQSFNAKRYCRACTTTKDQIKIDVSENEQLLRTWIQYEHDLLNNKFQDTGVKTVCIFNELKSFHVTNNICFDIMHDVLEGICVYDISSPYEKMTASEVLCFTNFLPLMIGDLISPDVKHWKLLVLLIEIVDLLFDSSFSKFDLDKLKNLIKAHHQLYILLYGNLKPKHHFLVHYPRAIEKCGPLNVTNTQVITDAVNHKFKVLSTTLAEEQQGGVWSAQMHSSSAANSTAAATNPGKVYREPLLSQYPQTKRNNEAQSQNWYQQLMNHINISI
ncbi:uncharacterized protein [Eurosta solidaginis]|uniref:uncharacterized protein n=1 Tax=Eurosta solidaginis TaxID=178769 RepID=UPI0035311007